MTLSEFLLARIAEDEAAAGDASEVGVQYKVKSHGNGLHDIGDEDWLGGLRIDTTRVLAECEAKRYLVECWTDDLDGHGSEQNAAQIVLGALAAVYADHPDYDEAWRP